MKELIECVTNNHKAAEIFNELSAKCRYRSARTAECVEYCTQTNGLCTLSDCTLEKKPGRIISAKFYCPDTDTEVTVDYSDMDFVKKYSNTASMDYMCPKCHVWHNIPDIQRT